MKETQYYLWFFDSANQKRYVHKVPYTPRLRTPLLGGSGDWFPDKFQPTLWTKRSTARRIGYKLRNEYDMPSLNVAVYPDTLGENDVN